MLDTFLIYSKILLGSSCISLHIQGDNDACIPREKTIFTGLINFVNQPRFKNKAIPDIRFGSGLCSLFKLYFLYLISLTNYLKNMNGHKAYWEEKCFRQ